MKKILFLLVVFFNLSICFGQDLDTNIVIKDSIIFETQFESIDTFDFSPMFEIEWYYSEWTDEIVNDTIIKTQYRISNEGIQEKRIIKILKKTVTEIIFDYYSKLKEKKDKDKDKDK